MLKTADPVLYGWNDYKIVKPEIKDQPNNSRRSDGCWVLLVDGSIKPDWYWESNNGESGHFAFKEYLISHWAYRNPPPFPEGFKSQAIEN